jgi:transposase
VIVAAERDEAVRAAWRQEAKQIKRDLLVFVDETSTTIAMTRRYARGPRGQRVAARVPRNYGKSKSLVAALSVDGLGAVMSLEGAFDRIAFEIYVDKLLCPTLRPGQVVVLDNLSIHNGVRTRECIKAVGCSLLFLPSYSPDYNPIEPGFSKFKELLRAAGARTQDTLDLAITEAIPKITSSDADGWFKHSGYP